MNPVCNAARSGLLFSALVMLILDGCSTKAANSSAPPPTKVGVVEVIQKDVPVYGDWVATLDGNVNANIQPQVSGYLVKQDYAEGSFVHKDDVLFEIDPRPFQAALDQSKAQLAQARGQVAQAQAALALAEINVKRDTPLAAARAIAQSQLDNDVQAKAQAEAQSRTAEGSVQAAEASIEQGELNLGFTRVKSLIDGIAGIAATQIGNLVGPTTILTTVSQVNPIKVYFPISEQEYLQLAKGNQAGSGLLRQNVPSRLQLILSNGDTYPSQGTSAFADRQVDSQTGTIRMVGVFPNPGNILRPGQFGRIRSLIGFHKSALLVPQRAVTELQGRYQIAVVGPENKVSIRNVGVGDRVGTLWVVTSGLMAGDKVVSEGTAKVREGMDVNPAPDTSDSGNAGGGGGQ
ncbi:MAG TPA: efflux RND transporter periplasmic adaptor subunit [Terriglobia bacterium]|jgi:membrane fusion protein (multidrug efflux system)